MTLLFISLAPYTLLTHPDVTPTGMFSVKTPPSGLTPAAGDGTTDDTLAIQAIVDYAALSNSNQNVFFPPGEYLVSSNIIITGPVQLHGSVDNISVLKASRAFSYYINNTRPVSSVRFEHLFFDGIRLRFFHVNSKDVRVEKCVFYSVARPPKSVTKSSLKDGQLKFLHVKNGRMENCIFLRDLHAFGVASIFYKTKNNVVTKNVFGLDLSKIGWLSTELGGEYWTKQQQKLGFLLRHFNLSPDQGFFNSSLYDGYDTNMHISKNVFNGSPRTGSLLKDHVIYLKGFNGMYVTGNYVRGWPSDPSGGIKARNGQNLVIARNYIDDTGILLYSHDPTGSDPPLYPGLKNVLIYSNHIVMRTNRGNWGTGISYYEPHWRTHSAKDENFRYVANKFEITGAKIPTDTCINLTNGNLSEHHIYSDNVYYPPRKATLAARYFPPVFESGKISFPIAVTYKEIQEYQLNIPVYSSKV